MSEFLQPDTRQPHRSLNVDDITPRQYNGPPAEIELRWAFYDSAEEPLDFYKFIFDNSGLANNPSMLDVGCADGRRLMELRAESQYETYKGNLTGLDIAYGAFETTIDSINKSGLRPIDFVRGSMSNLPFLDNSFDNSIAAFSLYHAPDPMVAIGELQRVTKPGGKIAVTTSGYGNKPRHREFEAAIADEFPGFNAPPIFSASFNAELASVELPKKFKVIQTAVQVTRFVITEEDFEDKYMIYKGSIDSMRQNYQNAVGKTIPGGKWSPVVESVVKKPIMDTIKENGFFADDIRRYGWILLNI